MSRFNKNQKGFTIIELAISTMVFAVVLLLITFGLLQIGRAFSKSVNESRVQEASRSISDEIASTIKFNGEDVTELTPIGGAGGATVRGYCAGRKRYSYILDTRVGSSPGEVAHAFVAEFMEESCTKATTPRDISIDYAATTQAVELLGPNMQIDKFSVTPAGQGGFYDINIRVIYGPSEDFMVSTTDPAAQVCDPGIGSTSFCAFSELSTTVQKRVE